jgi:Mn-dependent DtxR family transcriptional regulator
MKKLSISMENYLEAVYELSGEELGARITDIAARLQVSKASAHKAMSALAEKGLITNKKYQLINLTPEGLKLAKLTSQKHIIIKNYLIHILQVNEDTADTDACAIEHVISNDSVYAMYRQLTKGKLNDGINFDIE